MSSILAIDTASPGGIALAFAGGDTTPISSSEGPQDHSRQLLPAIDALIEGRRRDISAIAVTTGPGSYAGLRVGIATAESLGMGLSMPVFGFGTFAAIAEAARGSGASFAIHPAGRGEWAVQALGAEGPSGQPTIVAAAALPPVETLAGEGAGALGGREITPEERALAIARLAAGRMASGASPQGLEAFYLREPNITRPKRAPALPSRR